jgi:ArsR family transcriptional regulator
MDPISRATRFSQDDLSALQVIAEPNRARIIDLLRHGEHCGCDVGSALSLSPALVSHHLRALQAAGVLRERPQGRWVFYSLDQDRLAALRAAIGGILAPATIADRTCSDCAPTRGAS